MQREFASSVLREVALEVVLQSCLLGGTADFLLLMQLLLFGEEFVPCLRVDGALGQDHLLEEFVSVVLRGAEPCLGFEALASGESGSTPLVVLRDAGRQGSEDG